jgi:hypothetical protein
MLLNSFFDVSLGFPNIKAIATISFTSNFVHCFGSSAGGGVATVSAYPLHFVVLWAITWMATKVGICDAPQ